MLIDPLNTISDSDVEIIGKMDVTEFQLAALQRSFYDERGNLLDIEHGVLTVNEGDPFFLDNLETLKKLRVKIEWLIHCAEMEAKAALANHIGRKKREKKVKVKSDKRRTRTRKSK